MLPYSLISALTFGVLLLFVINKEKAETKLSNEDIIRTRLPKAVMGFFFALALGGTCGGTVLCIIYRNSKTELMCIAISFSLFAVIGWLGYVWGRFNYVVVDTDTIVVHRPFRKKKIYSFDEIACFKDTTNASVKGELICYDQNGKKMFSIEMMYVGVSLIAQRLKEKNIVQKL